MRRLFFTLASVVAGLAVTTVGAEPPPGVTERTMLGTIEMRWGDPLPDTDGTARSWTYFVSESGERWPIELTPDQLGAAGGVFALRSGRYAVTGWPVPGAERRFHVDALQPAEGASREIAGLFGSQPYIWLLLKFADDASEPQDRGWFLVQALGDRPSLNHYWMHTSYHNINLIGSNSTIWLDLPQPRSYYIYEFDPDHDGEDLDQQRTLDDALAVADPVVDFSDFAGLLMCFNGPLAGEAIGGWGELTLDGETRDWGIAWLGSFGWAAQDIVAHEMGHTFTWPHSSGPYDEIYDSRWDVMSLACGVCDENWDDEYGYIAIGSISYHRNQLEWIHPTHRHFMGLDPAVTAVYLNDLMVVPPTGRMLMVGIWEALPFVHYTVERRRFTGYDEAVPAESVVIHRVDLRRSNPAWVVDSDWDGDCNDEGAQWDLGETFHDAGSGTLVHVAEVDAGGSLVVFTNAAREWTFVDPGNSGYEDGSDASPWNTLFEGYGAAEPDGAVLMVADGYPGAYTFRKPATIVKWTGTGDVTIGSN